MDERELCLALMRADTEDEVVDLLTAAGYWDAPDAWRYFGDTENNFSSIGNQQGEPVAALIEKLVNSIDTRLLSACMEAGIDPEGENAPMDIRSAVGELFEKPLDIVRTEAGRVWEWPQAIQTQEAQLLTLSATGQGTDVISLSIADQGEGQMPDRFPDTFLSLQRSNKLRVPFVQGKFNMGGTGTLQFCSENHRLQLIVSRRNPALVENGSQHDDEWGFTIVRREPPSERMRSSVFTYLAPYGTQGGRDGEVLSFAAAGMPIFPRADREVRDAYARSAPYGSLVKLYDYQLTGTRSNIVASGAGLLRRVDFGMPEMALPIRLFECRPGYKGGPASFATNALGISARLERNKADAIEPGFPVNHMMRLDGREIRVRAFALKGSAKEYRNGNNAIIFSINGQTHATRTTDFFRRKRVGLSQIQDSLIVVVDCSDIDGQRREDMFMNSRDRLRTTTLSTELERGVEDFLKNDATIRELKNRRREEEVSARLDEAKPLAEALSELVQNNNALSNLLGGGRRISAPFPQSGQGRGASGQMFAGQRFPSYFRHRKRPDDPVYTRDAHVGSQIRLSFETDAEDGYFHRDVQPGAYEIDFRTDVAYGWEPLGFFGFTGPSSGICHVTLTLPDDLIAGDTLHLRIRVTDPSHDEPFELEAVLRARPPSEKTSGTDGRDRNKNKGTGTGDSGSGLAMPNVIPVYQEDWNRHDFDEYSAVEVKYQGDTTGAEEYDFYVNYDHRHLLTELKRPGHDIEAVRAQFVYSLVLYSMAILMKQPADPGADDSEPDNKEQLVRQVTRSIAPFVLPTLEAMSALAVD